MGSSPFSFVRMSIGYLYQAAKRRLRQWTKPLSHTLVLSAAMDLTRSRSELVLENAFLRQHVLAEYSHPFAFRAITQRDH
jgi:hypothetical protein